MFKHNHHNRWSTRIRDVFLMLFSHFQYIILRPRVAHRCFSENNCIGETKRRVSVFPHLRGVLFTSETFGTQTLGPRRQSEQNRQTIFELINVDGRPRRLMSRARVFSLFPTAPSPLLHLGRFGSAFLSFNHPFLLTLPPPPNERRVVHTNRQ